jgi:putative flippase GtrA
MRMIRRELTIFLIVGILTAIIDFLTYRVLLWTQLLDLYSAKGLGFLTGTIFAYFANRFWTFSHNNHAAGSFWRFFVLYIITLSVNVLVNSALISYLPIQLPVLLGMLLSIIKLTIINQSSYEDLQSMLNKLLNKEIVIEIAFLLTTITSAALNFIGMKLFVFKPTSIHK